MDWFTTARFTLALIVILAFTAMYGIEKFPWLSFLKMEGDRNRIREKALRSHLSQANGPYQARGYVIRGNED
jgi:hypothetical protein